MSEIIYPLNDFIGCVRITNKHSNPLLAVVNAARVSYNTEKEETDARDEKLSKFLWEHRHTSPFRHNFYTISIKAPLFVFRQWWKHQVAAPWLNIEGADTECAIDISAIEIDTDGAPSWNEVSGRYVKLDPEFYIPNTFRSNAGHANKQASSADESWGPEVHEELREDYARDCREAYAKYQSRLEFGVAREQARMLLPQNIYTSCVWTPSLQALLHFFELRCKDDAQWEIRRYAWAIRDLIQSDLNTLGIEL